VVRRMIGVVGVFILAASLASLAQEQPTTPAASRSQVDCSGFISASKVARNLYIHDGADNDFHTPLHQFRTGQFVYLRGPKSNRVDVGAEYALVRSGKELFRTAWYEGQHWSMRSLGHVYEDVGRVKVIRLTPAGAVAEVEFACGPVIRGDIAMPYAARAIPEYAPKEFERFAPWSGKRVGAITAAMNDTVVLGTGSLGYVSLGETDGVRVGQRFRVFHNPASPDMGAPLLRWTPRESLGEMVIVSTQKKSAVGIVVTCVREIYLGDGVEME